MTTIQQQFDRIAQLPDDGWNHNNHYYPFLLRHVPPHCNHALEIGCGTGGFSRELTRYAEHVTALDLSPEMARIAQQRSQGYLNLNFSVADAVTWDYPPDHFDCVVSIATLHHLSLEDILMKIKPTLRVDGVLMVLDLVKSETLTDRVSDSVALPIHAAYQLTKNGRSRPSEEARAVWEEHGQTDVYLTLNQVRQTCAKVLPGAQVRKHLLWRYSLIWTKTASIE